MKHNPHAFICGCLACRQEHRRKVKKRRSFPHGTAKRRKLGCHCEACEEAYRKSKGLASRTRRRLSGDADLRTTLKNALETL